MAYLTHGFLKDGYDKCLDFFANRLDCDVHVKSYEGEHEVSTGFAESEFAGKYVDTCIQFYKASKNEKLLESAGKVVRSMIKNQHDDGYLGGYTKDGMWKAFSVWNQAFSVYGLISYYKETGNADALAAAEKCVKNIAEHYMSEKDDILDADNYGTQNISILITLPELYAITKNKIYMDFMEYIFSRLSRSSNNFFEFDSILNLFSRKGIENFAILISMVMYYEMTKKEQGFNGAKKYWEELRNTQIRRPGNGTIEELWTENGNKPQFLNGDMRPNETCVSVGYCELSMTLFEQTGEAKYIDAIERTLFNHIMGSLDENGEDFAYYQPNYGKRITRTNQSMYKCCRYRGFNAISRLNDVLFREDEKTVIPLIYASSVYENGTVRIEEETNYPFDDKITFKVIGDSDKGLKLRIPEWCDKYNISVNGKSIETDVIAEYAVIESINNGDVITLSLNTKLQCENVVIDGKDYAGFSYGAVVLVPDSSLCSDIYGEKNPDMELIRKEDTEYNIEFDCEQLCLVDYASAAKKHDGDEYTEWVKIRK